MKCIAPNQIKDGDLLTFIEGEADDALKQHIAECAYCKAVVEALHQTDYLLLSALFRQDCPPTLDLTRYHEKQLPREQEQQIAQHLEICPHCQEELQFASQILDQFVVVDEKDPSWRQALGYLWQRVQETGTLVIRFLEAPPQLQLEGIAVKNAAVVADESNVLRRITLTPDVVEDVDLEAIVTPDPQNPEWCQIKVKVEIPSRWPVLSGTPITAQAGDWQAQGVTGEDGRVILTGLPRSVIDNVRLEVHTDS